jgi:hypothetical protein
VRHPLAQWMSPPQPGYRAGSQMALAEGLATARARLAHVRSWDHGLAQRRRDRLPWLRRAHHRRLYANGDFVQDLPCLSSTSE